MKGKSCLVQRLALLTGLVTLLRSSEATHFRFGSMSWERLPESSGFQPFTARFHWEFAFRHSMWPHLAVDDKVEGRYATFIVNYGDGSGSHYLDLFVTVTNDDGDWFLCRGTSDHTFPGATVPGTNSPFYVSHTSGNRLSNLINNHDEK